MIRLLTLISLASLTIGSLGQPAAEDALRRKALFCPECWTFLSDPWDLDLQGRCLASKKKPVELQAVTVNWYWCRSHIAWHPQPCGRGPAVAWPATALLVPDGSEPVSVHAYCPADLVMSLREPPGQPCPICGKPYAAANAVQRQWFWCATEKAWLSTACAANARLRCCSARQGPVLAHPWQLPILNEVSYTGAVRQEMRVDAEWLAAHLDDPHLVVLHIGFDPTDAENAVRPSYGDGHIQGARSVAWGELVRTRNGLPNEMPPAEDLVQMVRSLGIDAGDRIVLYDTGCGIEAARAYLTLDYLGLGDQTALLDGQWALWKTMNLPQSRMPEEVEPSAFVPRLHPEILLSLQAMKDLSWLARQGEASAVILDARSDEEFSGYRPGKGILRGGHIAGATNLCWIQLLEPAEYPALLSEFELRGVFESSGARPGRMVATYCRSGTEASLLYFAAKYLGYEARFYDGSYYEWSRDDENKVQGGWARR